jgi:hypothetical protein
MLILAKTFEHTRKRKPKSMVLLAGKPFKSKALGMGTTQ